MPKHIKIVVSTVVVVFAVSLFLLINDQSSDKKTSTTVSTSANTTNAATDLKAQPETPTNTAVQLASYITLADYQANPEKYTNTKKVYFFHASWCPICQGIDKEISADTSKIPSGVTIIKTDFDSAIELRKKYGVTYQYTFVQVDSSNNELAQWSASSLQKALNGIKS